MEVENKDHRAPYDLWQKLIYHGGRNRLGPNARISNMGNEKPLFTTRPPLAYFQNRTMAGNLFDIIINWRFKFNNIVSTWRCLVSCLIMISMKESWMEIVQYLPEPNPMVMMLCLHSPNIQLLGLCTNLHYFRSRKKIKIFVKSLLHLVY